MGFLAALDVAIVVSTNNVLTIYFDGRLESTADNN